ncbi:MAG: hypothetical protein IJK28_08870 [Clostridia bacterium]|nr:hypothetical protein [Candidatus Methanomethylophilaceae archaeon]MBQ6174723.1 hypothetical protein [Clostridia bacterium]MBQ6177866.1 hypothetical protein [Bacteroidales bacterium]
MEKKSSYTEDELVQMYQDGEITLAELVVFHPSEWGEEFALFLARHPERSEEENAQAFLDLKDSELEKAMERGDA